MPWAEVKRVCHDYTIAGLEAIFEGRGTDKSTPLRFLYMSGVAAERDQSKTPTFMAKYSLMRVSYPVPMRESTYSRLEPG